MIDFAGKQRKIAGFFAVFGWRWIETVLKPRKNTEKQSESIDFPFFFNFPAENSLFSHFTFLSSFKLHQKLAFFPLFPAKLQTNTVK